jgi:hypothetical protein
LPVRSRKENGDKNRGRSKKWNKKMVPTIPKTGFENNVLLKKNEN